VGSWTYVRQVRGHMEDAPPWSRVVLPVVVVVASLVVFETTSITSLVVVVFLMVSRTASVMSLVVAVRATSHQTTSYSGWYDEGCPSMRPYSPQKMVTQ
jgi:hypothetical protein